MYERNAVRVYRKQTVKITEKYLDLLPRPVVLMEL